MRLRFQNLYLFPLLLGSTLTLSLSIGCSGSSSAAPKPDAPVFLADPADLTVSAGADAKFSVVAQHTNSYKWQKSTNNGTTWVDIAGATSSNYTWSKVTQADSGAQVHAIATGDGGTLTSKAATLTVQFSPSSLKLDITDHGSTGNPTQDYLWWVVPTGKTATSVSFDAFIPSTCLFKAFQPGVVAGGWNASWTQFGASDAWSHYSATGLSAVGDGAVAVGFQVATGDPTGQDVGSTTIWIDNFKVTFSDGTTQLFDFNAPTDLTQFLTKPGGDSGVATLTTSLDSSKNKTAPVGPAKYGALKALLHAATGAANGYNKDFLTVPVPTGETVASLSVDVMYPTTGSIVTAACFGSVEGTWNMGDSGNWISPAFDSTWATHLVTFTTKPTDTDRIGIAFFTTPPASATDSVVYVDNLKLTFSSGKVKTYTFDTNADLSDFSIDLNPNAPPANDAVTHTNGAISWDGTQGN